MKTRPLILVVEDEVAIRVGLTDVLIYHGFDVDYAEDGEEGLTKSLTGKYDLIILDVMLPKVDGFEICRLIREQSRSQAIIMLTAKTTDEDVISGLTLGADDYVTKPFSVAQLILRIKAVLRRSMKESSAPEVIQLDKDQQIDVNNLCIESPNQTIPFTKREMAVITYLHANKDRPVAREELLAKVWGYTEQMEIETRTVDIHIARIRRKIEVVPKQPQFLITVRGAGYKLLSANQLKED